MRRGRTTPSDRWNKRPRPSHAGRASGFTLLEIAIAIGTLSIIFLVVYNSLSGIIRSKQALDSDRDARTIANAILLRLSRELQLAYQGIPLLPPPDNLEERYSPKINLIGEEKTLANQERGDTVKFIALEGGQYLPDGGAHSGLVQITYRVEPDPEQPDESKTFYLVREETPYARPFETAYKNTMIFPITKMLVGLRFRYFDDEEQVWTDTWGRERLVKLPRMIEFMVSILSPNGKVRRYTSAVPLRRRY